MSFWLEPVPVENGGSFISCRNCIVPTGACRARNNKWVTEMSPIFFKYKYVSFEKKVLLQDQFLQFRTSISGKFNKIHPFRKMGEVDLA